MNSDIYNLTNQSSNISRIDRKVIQLLAVNYEVYRIPVAYSTILTKHNNSYNCQQAIIKKSRSILDLVSVCRYMFYFSKKSKKNYYTLASFQYWLSVTPSDFFRFSSEKNQTSLLVHWYISYVPITEKNYSITSGLHKLFDKWY